MADNKKELKTQGKDRTGITGRTDGRHNGPAAQPWYAAQPTRTGVAYALTQTGYVILTHKN